MASYETSVPDDVPFGRWYLTAADFGQEMLPAATLIVNATTPIGDVRFFDDLSESAQLREDPNSEAAQREALLSYLAVGTTTVPKDVEAAFAEDEHQLLVEVKGRRGSFALEYDWAKP
ncbi:MAG: hypothetical protein MUF27_13100 [Acidobacteria bacterium]|nr:hypothetical protein [Acidobacteriota bacterium]